MCVPLNEYSDHMWVLYLITLRTHLRYTAYVNNGSIIGQVNFGFPGFSDSPGTCVWTYTLRLGPPICQKSDCPNYLRSGGVCLLRSLFAESFSR